VLGYFRSNILKKKNQVGGKNGGLIKRAGVGMVRGHDVRCSPRGKGGRRSQSKPVFDDMPEEGDPEDIAL